MERNWCRLCGRDYTHGEPVQAPAAEVTGTAAARSAQPATAQPLSQSLPVDASDAASAGIAKKIRFHKAMLAVARQSEDTPDARAEVERHEAELTRLAAEEKAALPAESRLRSLLDRVRHREKTTSSADLKVSELTTQLEQARKVAEEARSVFEADRLELAQLQATMAKTQQPKEPAPADAAVALRDLLAAVKSAASGDGDQRQQLQAAADAAEQFTKPKGGAAPGTEGQGQKREAQASQDTVVGTQELSPEDADVLMQEMEQESTPEAKKARLMAAWGARQA